jgi:molybdopterin converting factor small subunit
VRFWAAARAAAGADTEPYDAATLADAIAAMKSRHDVRLGVLLDRCAFVVDDAHIGGRPHDTVTLTEGGSIEVLPPFAGG